ncbi:MAG: sulfatase-like hydrolase/transferase [Phycisphaerae bacterium]
MRLRFWLLAWVVAVCVSLSACKRVERGVLPTGAKSGQAAGCNLLLITMDTTRADRLGCYGWPAAHTPNLDMLADRGVRFSQAYSHVPITLPSHASLLTGTLPPEHGVRDNGRFRLGPVLPTLGEAFQKHGYRTGAFVSARVLDSRHGLDRGFDVYDDTMARDSTGKPFLDRNAKLVSDAALSWLEQDAEAPFMCWVHFFDPHAPYDPPPRFRTASMDSYDGEIAFMDRNIGRLLRWLRTARIYGRTLIIVVADHGESLGEHGFKWHALLVYDSIMRVPLLVSLPGKIPRGATYDGLVAVSDIMPTVLETMGWEVPAEVSGLSLLPALNGQTMADRSIYGETDFPYYSFGWAKLRCWTEPGWRYIRGPWVELFDRSEDPGELHNLAQQHPEVVGRMETALARFEESLVRRDASPLAMDEETRQALKSLGYVGDGGTAPDTGNRPHPVDLLELVYDFRMADSWIEAGQPSKAIPLLAPAARKSPDSFVIVEALGRAYLYAGQAGQSLTPLEKAVALNPESANTHLLLVQALGAVGRLDEADRHLALAESLEPDRADAEALRGALAAQRGDTDGAINHYRRSLAIDGHVPEVYDDWAWLLRKSNRQAEAIDVLRAGLEQVPQSNRLARHLAKLLVVVEDPAQRDPDEALRLARDVCTREGRRDPRSLHALALAYYGSGRFEEALREARLAKAMAQQGGQARLVDVLRGLIQRCRNERSSQAAPTSQPGDPKE